MGDEGGDYSTPCVTSYANHSEAARNLTGLGVLRIKEGKKKEM